MRKIGDCGGVFIKYKYPFCGYYTFYYEPNGSKKMLPYVRKPNLDEIIQ
jgi:hypothetical protein